MKIINYNYHSSGYDNAFFESEFQRQERLVSQSVETGKLIDEIVTLDVKSAKDFEGLTLLYKKIFAFLLFKNKEIAATTTDEFTSSITTFNIEKEVAAALESVIPRAALGPFVSLNPSEKVTQLVELANLVIGIRLFNKEIGKGGSSLSSVAELIANNDEHLGDVLRQEATDTVESCYNYTVFFLQLSKLNLTLDTAEIAKFKDELTFLRQYLSFILSIQEDEEISESTVETNETRYFKEINELKHLLGNKSSAPKEQVYPKFATLSQAYVQLLEERKLGKNRNNLIKFLIDSKKKMKFSLPEIYIRNAKSLTDEEKPLDMEENEEMLAVKFNQNPEIARLSPKTTADFQQTPLDYLGFCVWSIVSRGGLLIPGKPNLGVYRYRNKHCVFSSVEGIKHFVENPNQYLEGVIEKCRRNPELIHLLRMDENFKHLQLNQMNQKQGKVSTKLLMDKGIETPLHFVEKNFDSNYCWNEWELRKKAIQMANIRKRKTKATQTILSNFKVDSDTQTWLPKEKATNTGISVGTNPVRPKNYILGLRDKNTQ